MLRHGFSWGAALSHSVVVAGGSATDRTVEGKDDLIEGARFAATIEGVGLEVIGVGGTAMSNAEEAGRNRPFCEQHNHRGRWRMWDRVAPPMRPRSEQRARWRCLATASLGRDRPDRRQTLRLDDAAFSRADHQLRPASGQLGRDHISRPAGQLLRLGQVGDGARSHPELRGRRPDPRGLTEDVANRVARDSRPIRSMARVPRIEESFGYRDPLLRLHEAMRSRHRLSHGYRAIDVGMLWETVSMSVPQTIKADEEVLRRGQ